MDDGSNVGMSYSINLSWKKPDDGPIIVNFNESDDKQTTTKVDWNLRDSVGCLALPFSRNRSFIEQRELSNDSKETMVNGRI
jgi:hypothetical protein